MAQPRREMTREQEKLFRKTPGTYEWDVDREPQKTYQPTPPEDIHKPGLRDRLSGMGNN